MPFKNNPIDISLVIPAFKEEKRIGVTLDDLAEYIQTDSVISKLKVEVIVVDLVRHYHDTAHIPK